MQTWKFLLFVPKLLLPSPSQIFLPQNSLCMPAISHVVKISYPKFLPCTLVLLFCFSRPKFSPQPLPSRRNFRMDGIHLPPLPLHDLSWTLHIFPPLRPTALLTPPCSLKSATPLSRPLPGTPLPRNGHSATSWRSTLCISTHSLFCLPYCRTCTTNSLPDGNSDRNLPTLRALLLYFLFLPLFFFVILRNKLLLLPLLLHCTIATTTP